ncbi:MAG: QueT transporter family protein [Coriobacteriales bacterium]|jgi:uncharacterized membrane protein|nr:QueT transporter family protein [Coriobacteriales bacterium]
MQQNITRAGLIAALYAALTLLTMTLLGGFSFGPVQLRISEAVCIFAILSRSAIPGLTIGCVIANLLGIAILGTGPLGLLDVCFGSLATLLGSLWAWKWRKRTAIALAGPVIANALIVPAYLPIMLATAGFYTIPFTDIDLASSYLLMYIFGFVAIAIGEALVVYVLGLPLLAGLKRTPLFKQQKASQDAQEQNA